MAIVAGTDTHAPTGPQIQRTQKAVGVECKIMANSQLPPGPDGNAQHRGPHTWKMWYFMSLISMVLPPSPSCSDLLVISVLNLEQRG